MEVAHIDGLLLPIDDPDKGSVVLVGPFLVDVCVIGVVGDVILSIVSMAIVGNMRPPLVPIAVGHYFPRVSLLRQH